MTIETKTGIEALEAALGWADTGAVMLRLEAEGHQTRGDRDKAKPVLGQADAMIEANKAARVSLGAIGDVVKADPKPDKTAAIIKRVRAGEATQAQVEWLADVTERTRAALAALRGEQ